MSALIVVTKSRSIEILSDAATIWLATGAVESIRSKLDTTTIPGAVLAPVGLWEPFAVFAKLARERCTDWDALAASCGALWADAQAEAPAPPGVEHGVLLAGWSERRHCLEALNIDTEQGSQVSLVTVLATAASEESNPCIDAFISRFAEHPESFHPRHDGLGLMKTLRAHRRDFGIFGSHPGVGGFVEHASITSSGVTSRRIYAWPDRVGEVIRLDAVPRYVAAHPTLELGHA